MAVEPTKKTLTDKLKELKEKEEEKKKELDELKKKLDDESKEIKEEITKTLRVLREEEERLFEEREKKKENLEEIAGNQKTQGEKENEKLAFEYNTLESKNMYEMANREFYDKIKNLVDKSEHGYITQQEKNFLSKVTYKVTQMKTENEYVRHKKDPKDYISRMDVLLLNVGDDW